MNDSSANEAQARAPQPEGISSRWWFAPALLALTILVVLLPVLFLGDVFFLKDMQQWFYPSRLFYRAHVISGDLPLWIHQLGMGQRFLADPGNAVLYPPNLLLLLPSPACVGQYLAAHVLLAGLGSYALVRELGGSRCASYVGGLSFALGGYLLSMAAWSGTYLLAIAWMPLVVCLGLALVRRPGARRLAAMALALALQMLTGEFQGVAFTGVLLLVLCLSEPLPWRSLALRLLWPAAAALIAVALALPQVLTTLSLLQESSRAGGIEIGEASHWSFHPLRFLELVVPKAFGDPVDASSFLGSFMNDEGGNKHRAPWILSPYLGSITLVFAAIGVWAAPHQARRRARALALLLIPLVLLALGRHTPVFSAYLEFVPGADLFRYPAKFFGLIALVLPLLASIGLDVILAWPRRRVRFVGLCLFGLSGLLALAWALTVLVLPDHAAAIVREALASELALVLLAALGMWLTLKRAPAALGPVLCAALALQLVIRAAGVLITTHGSLYSSPPALAQDVKQGTPAHAWPRVLVDPEILARTGLNTADPEQAAWKLKESLRKNIGVSFGLSYPNTYSATDSPWHAEWWQATQDMQRPALDIYGIGHLVLPARTRMDPRLGLRKVGQLDEAGLAVFENAHARPFVYAAFPVVQVQTGADALVAIHTTTIQRGSGAVLEGDLLAEPSEASPGTCVLSKRPGDSIDFTCELSRTSWVVVQTSYHPNWSARVEGAAVPIRRANAVVMAVQVPAGDHAVHLSFHEPGLGHGLPITACVLVLVFLGLVFDRPRFPRRPPA